MSCSPINSHLRGHIEYNTCATELDSSDEENAACDYTPNFEKEKEINQKLDDAVVMVHCTY